MAKEFELRAERVRKEMDENNIDVALIYQSGRAWAYGDFAYISNYVPCGSNAMVILPRDGDPVLLVSNMLDLAMARDMSWIEDIRLSKNFAKETGKVLISKNLATKTVGLVGIQIGRPKEVIGLGFQQWLH